MFNNFVRFVQEMYSTTELIPLHAPQFNGNEKKYLLEAIDSTFVSSVGEFVDKFEHKVAEYTGVKYAVATVNGTAALHMALQLSGVRKDTEVITQSLTFVATCNAIYYCNAKPIFIDVDKETLGLSPVSLKAFLEEYGELRNDGCCWNKKSNKKIAACLPMHTFGFPVRLQEIKKICDDYHIELVEDAAEALGSLYKNKHVGMFGKISAISFNGNKIITSGGGGMILTNSKELAIRAKHLTTTAKIAHRWNFEHDDIGYNYRLPNLNAALGVAQMEELPERLTSKRIIAQHYQKWGDDYGLQFMREPHETRSNYWLNVALTQDQQQRDIMLEVTNKHDIMTRPAWSPMHKLRMNNGCQRDELINTLWIHERVVNVPSSAHFKN